MEWPDDKIDIYFFYIFHDDKRYSIGDLNMQEITYLTLFNGDTKYTVADPSCFFWEPNNFYAFWSIHTPSIVGLDKQ